MAFLKRRSRGSFKPSSSDRQSAVYLGQYPVEENASLDQASPALDHLYRNYKDGTEQRQRVTVEVIVNGLVINKIKGFSPRSDSATSGETSRTLLAACKMSFCAVDPARPKVFFIVKRSGSDVGDAPNTNSINEECHAFLCETASSAKTVTLQLVDMFKNIGDGQSTLAYKTSYGYAVIRSQQQTWEKGLQRSQSVNLPRSRNRQEAVSALKITMNVEDMIHRGGFAKEANNNAEIARIIAKRDSEQTLRSESANYPARDDEVGPVLGRASHYQASTVGERVGGMISRERSEVPPTHYKPIVTFNPDESESSTKLLRESQLAAVLEQSPASSPKQSPKERRMAAQKAEETEENQEVEENQSDRANKRKSVRFAEDAEII